MKKPLLVCFLVSGCVTSSSLYDRAAMACRNVPKKDAEQLVCIHNYIRKACINMGLDVKICGKNINMELK